MRLSRGPQRQSILNVGRKSIRNMFKARACNAVGIVIHGGKYRIDDFPNVDPKVEHIAAIERGNQADCIQAVVDAVLVEGRKNKKTEKIVEVFFNEPKESDGKIIFQNGEEIAELVNSFESEHFKLRFITSIINVFISTLNENAVDRVISAFNKLNDTYDESALLFLKQINLIAKKHQDAKKIIEFCDAVSSHSMIICLKQFSENEEQPTLAPDFMNKMCELCTIMPDEKIFNIVPLSMFEIYGSVMANRGDVKTINAVLESLKKVAEESGNSEYVCAAAEGAKTICINGQKNELLAFFEIVRILPVHVEDMEEAAIGLVQVAKEIGRGRKAEELGQKYITLRGGNIGTGQERITGEFEIDAPKEAEEESREERESEYPEIQEEHEGDITVSRAEKLEMQFRDMLGDETGDAFEKKAMFVNKEEEVDFCNHYIQIYEIIKEKSDSMNKGKREKYLELAEDMFKNMNNDLKFAPVAYSVLGELVEEYPVEQITRFVDNVGKAKDDKLLMYLCHEIRKPQE